MLNKIIATSILVFILAAASISAQTIQCECPPFECSSPATCCNTEPPTPLVSALCKLCLGNAELLYVLYHDVQCDKGVPREVHDTIDGPPALCRVEHEFLVTAYTDPGGVPDATFHY
ncbi:hypothetical protein K438DRAFT_1759164 [Mycena galopus ATCC 62051]|nr:hypothetical protein K438DRAFT_1759164 [Mycena galopus ATCC 62051]